MVEFFADVLEEYIVLRGQISGRLATLSDVPKTTIQSWREGRVKRPRHIDPVLQVAKALHLTIEQTNRLLSVSKHPSLVDIRKRRYSQFIAYVNRTLFDSHHNTQHGWRFEYMRTSTRVAQLKWYWKQDATILDTLKEILDVFTQMGAVHEIARVQTLIEEIQRSIR